ncbi:UDP-N-acetylglucosamine 1-carboxyvinyltransferase [Sinanaerobacter chloroacetimidivorans]|uniref:UDP-N-acetylglucosamine 1-carboxyvinyltransferase n=1 Tax=Sinanaerobacter chloroacetimidivorans TaxID=2818044 RepID=A0A8J7W3X6_9FIRM|nr:UDP-N-acetylglucosamine 1-carboxyvinyltransferase [Sinanaerobacter chloroacetimidivorans]MBR0600447.1 UDP-N-acetylglucosamine 1-carboxyvinyltransferase [Sinanaerobacter chloroacetimidivorans]
MAKFLVEKSGPLQGEIEISGSKNAVLPIMAAALLTEEKCEIMDVPVLRDVDVMCKLLSSIGSEVKEDYINNLIEIQTKSIIAEEAPYELVKKMRASILVMGPLLAKTGKAKIALPGGCAIGARPIDLHLKGFQALGAEIVEGHGYVEARADKLVGCNVYLDFPSVGATENIMMAAVLAEGITVIENVAEEPEIVDLANFLNKMGAKIKGAGTDTIKIEGVEKLHGTKHAVIPDRIETGTFMVAAAITRGNVLIKNVVPDHVKPVIAKLKECGAVIEDSDEGMRVRGDINPLISTDIKTLPYPGFPTDMQSQFMAFLTTVAGASVVIETVFENRYMHIGELNRMGANIKIEGRSAIIQGDRKLQGAQVISTDLRAGAALVLAGLMAEGTTEISEVYHIERGYADFIRKFKALGAKITRMEE